MYHFPIMGGLVARYALRQMEQNATSHQTRLFVSFDAPYQGANVPLGLQALNTHLSSTSVKIGVPGGPISYITTVGNFVSPLKVYETPAARQLLTYYVIRQGNGFTMYNNAHDQLYNTLKGMGYPVNTRNVAIANGSECGAGLPLTPGNDLLRLSGHYNTTLLGSLLFTIPAALIGSHTNFPQFLLGIIPGRNDIKCSFRVKTTPASGTTEVYNGKVWYEKKILWLIPRQQWGDHLNGQYLWGLWSVQHSAIGNHWGRNTYLPGSLPGLHHR
ncbi:hypothetical protein [Paraflavitalea pollutisoli]|uniref:hypothetical protein n=1 Tax=Paraflavitalea pollutisoli TaxID=3034143 RepID=UPI0023ED55EF|nr:hypothetical protein [Paraflavitalea sp. H1-2-19X]